VASLVGAWAVDARQALPNTTTAPLRPKAVRGSPKTPTSRSFGNPTCAPPPVLP